MCDKAVDACLPAQKSVPDWRVVKKMFENLDNVVFFNDDIELDDIHSDTLTFFSDEMDLVTIDLNKINLDGGNLMKMILKLLSMLNSWLGVIDISNVKHVKKDRQRTTAYCMTFNKSVGLVYDKIRKYVE